MRIKQAIPNLLTLANLFCGALAIVALFNPYIFPGQHTLIILVLFVLALVFDFLDGFVARLLKVSSPLGKELDSLADVITFGLLPGLMVFQMLMHNSFFGVIQNPGTENISYTLSPPSFYFALIGLLIPVFSALRLAKFNIDDRQSNTFIGLATPANAIFWVSVFLIYNFDSDFYYSGRMIVYSPLSAMLAGNSNFPILDNVPSFLAWENYLCHPYVLAGLSVIFSLLLVSPIKLIAFKFKGFSLANNWHKYAFILISVILLILFFYRAVPIIILLYFVFSIIGNLFIRENEIHSNH